MNNGNGNGKKTNNTVPPTTPHVVPPLSNKSTNKNSSNKSENNKKSNVNMENKPINNVTLKSVENINKNINGANQKKKGVMNVYGYTEVYYYGISFILVCVLISILYILYYIIGLGAKGPSTETYINLFL